MAFQKMIRPYATIKAVAIAAALFGISALGGCGPVLTDAQEAAQACRGVRGQNAHDVCVSNYVATARAGIDAQWAAIGNGMLAHPSYGRAAAVTCTRSGGVTICN